MKRLRLLLLPFGAVVELSILATCWAIATFSPAAAQQLHDWATRTLPTIHWYTAE